MKKKSNKKKRAPIVYKIKLITNKQVKDCVKLLQKSFLPLAKQYKLTPENAPAYVAFITEEKLHDSIKHSLDLYGLFKNNILQGCVGIRASQENSSDFWIERLAVLPAVQNKGFGKQLMDFAVRQIKDLGGDQIFISIMDENTRLKQWYIKMGFSEQEKLSFSHLPFTVCHLKKSLPASRYSENI